MGGREGAREGSGAACSTEVARARFWGTIDRTSKPARKHACPVKFERRVLATRHVRLASSDDTRLGPAAVTSMACPPS